METLPSNCKADISYHVVFQTCGNVLAVAFDEFNPALTETKPGWVLVYQLYNGSQSSLLLKHEIQGILAETGQK